MVKSKVFSSLELLKISKPRVQLILKNLIDDLMTLCNENYCENLNDFKNLCIRLKSNGISDISSFISKNILDYDVKINDLSNTAYIELNFKNTFPINKLVVNDLKF